MSNIYVLYTEGASLYGVATNTAGSGTALTEVQDGLYLADSTKPYIFNDADDSLVMKADDVKYGTVAEGDLFHMKRMHSWDWSQATTFDKVRSLYTATMLMEKFNFIGVKTDSDQGLEFPRTRTDNDGTAHLIGGTAGIPTAMKEAAYLIAEALLSGRSPEDDFESQNIKVETFGPVRTEYATDKGPMQHTANMIPSPSAWALMRPFLEISTSFGVNRA